jgi:four helix bundle protein
LKDKLPVNSIVQKKSFDFALKIIKLYKALYKQKEFVLSRQLLRSGTSIGANVEEALASQTRKEFHSKMTIAFKETRETRYWLRLLKTSELVDCDYSECLNDVEELNRILSAITKSTKVEKLKSEV